MESLKRILGKHPLFKGMEDEHLVLLVGCASNVRFTAARPIFREGEAADQFYLIREGKIALDIFSPPRGSLVLQTLGEGDVLGWSWLFPPYRWKFTARVVEPVRAIAMDGRCLRGKAEEDHDLGYELLKRFARIIQDRLQATRLQLINVYEVHK